MGFLHKRLAAYLYSGPTDTLHLKISKACSSHILLQKQVVEGRYETLVPNLVFLVRFPESLSCLDLCSSNLIILSFLRISLASLAI